MMHRARLTAALALAALAGAPAWADTVVLKNGQIHYGTILENTPRKIKIRTIISNIVTEVEIPRYQVREFSIEEDTRIDQKQPAKPEASPAAAEAAEEEAPPPVLKRPGVPLVLEVPLKGTFGQDIYPKSVAAALGWAVQNEVSDVVFRIDSPGGEVWAADQIIEIMRRHDDKLTYHALVERGISASIWPTFACKTIAMPPGATLGGAVVFSMGASGNAEVDAKMNSIIAADLSAMAESNGHNPDVVKAMILANAELYAWRDKRNPGPWKITADRSAAYENARDREIQDLDSKTSVLTLTADKAIWLGVARPLDSKSLDALARAAGMDEFDNAGNYGTLATDEWAPHCAKLRKEIDLSISSVLNDFARAGGTNRISIRMAALNSAKRGLTELDRLTRRAKDLEMDDVLTEYDTLDRDHLVKEIDKDLADLRRLRQGG